MIQRIKKPAIILAALLWVLVLLPAESVMAEPRTLQGTVGPAAYNSPAALDKAYLTLLFSRSEITAAIRCVQNDAGVARLDTVVAPELARRGLRPTGTVQTAETLENGYRCIHGRKT